MCVDNLFCHNWEVANKSAWALRDYNSVMENSGYNDSYIRNYFPDVDVNDLFRIGDLIREARDYHVNIMWLWRNRKPFAAN